MVRVRLIWILFLHQVLGSNVTDIGCRGTTCYWVVGPETDWRIAGKHCHDFNGGNLATIPDEETNTFLWSRTYQLGVSVWIGVVYKSIPWSWVNGTLYTAKIEDTDEDCTPCGSLSVGTNNSQAQILAFDCFERRAFICSKEEKGSWEISISSSIETWPRARQRCIQIGMDLAVFPNLPLASIAARIRKETRLEHFWIGLNSRKWISVSSGEELTYVNVNHGDCRAFFALGSSGTWDQGGYCCKPSLCSLDGTQGTATVTTQSTSGAITPTPQIQTNKPDPIKSNVTELGCIGKACYWLVGPETKWKEAGKLCYDFNGGTLATIPDEETNTFLWRRTFQLGVTPWIGVVYTSIPWSWVTNKPYTGMIEDTTKDNSPCAFIVLGTANSEVKVAADECFEQRPFICSNGDATLGSWNISVSTSVDTWPTARQRCKQRGMDLAVFPDIPLDSVAARVKKETSLIDFWIGAYSKKWISVSTGLEVTFIKATVQDWRHIYVLGSDGSWQYAYDCCQPSICSLGGPGAAQKQPDFLPNEKSTAEPNSNLISVQGNQEGGFNAVYQVVIPIICSLAIGIILAVAIYFTWRRTAASHIRRITDAQQMDNIRSSVKGNKPNLRGFENPEVILDEGTPVYEALGEQEDTNSYVEVTG